MWNDTFFPILLVPKNQNNGLHPSESSDITNTQNRFFGVFSIWTGKWAHGIMRVWCSRKISMKMQKCQQQRVQALAPACASALQVPAAHVRTWQQPGFMICCFDHELCPLVSVSFWELRRHNVLAFFLEGSVAGGAVTAPTAHTTHPSFLRTVHQPGWVKHSSESASGTVDTSHYLKVEKVHFLYQWQKNRAENSSWL